jgi:hypothetical protein
MASDPKGSAGNNQFHKQVAEYSSRFGVDLQRNRRLPGGFTGP